MPTWIKRTNIRNEIAYRLEFPMLAHRTFLQALLIFLPLHVFKFRARPAANLK